MNLLFLQLLSVVLPLSIIFLHLSKKNFDAAVAYGVQSLAIVLVLFGSFLETGDLFLFLIVLLTLVVKVVLAPTFFVKLIKRHNFTFSVSTYLNTPLSLVVLAVIMFAAHSKGLQALTAIVPDHYEMLSLAIFSIFSSLFLVVNRKGALSQVLGILSLENSIVAFAIFAGLEQAPMFQIGIIFDIFIWVVISTVFLSMLFRHFKAPDTSLMKRLTD